MTTGKVMSRSYLVRCIWQRRFCVKVQAAHDMAMFGPPFVAAFIHQVADNKALGPCRV